MWGNKITGSIGEHIASEYLQKKGYHIIECNANLRWGEIDIVAEKQGIIIFVEVKTRKSLKQGKPYEAVSYQKIRHLMRSIQYYIKSKDLGKRKFRIDVISIILNQNNSLSELKHFENLDAQF